MTLPNKLAAQFTTLVLDNARYHRNAYVMAEAERLVMTLLWLPTYSPNLNLIERLWQFVKADELCSQYWWCLHGRYSPKFTSNRRSSIAWPTPVVAITPSSAPC